MAHSFDDQKPPRLRLYAVQNSDGPNKGKKARYLRRTTGREKDKNVRYLAVPDGMDMRVWVLVYVIFL